MVSEPIRRRGFDSTCESSVQADAEQVLRMIRQSRPASAAALRARRLILLALTAVAAILVLSARPDDPAWRTYVPLLLMGGVMAVSWWFAIAARRAHSCHSQAVQAAQTRQWGQAYAALAKLMSRPVNSPGVRASALLVLAEIATRNGRHDEAVAALDEVLRGPAGWQQRQLALVEKAHALLRCQRLTDATGLLDSFRTTDFAEPMATMAELGWAHHRIRTRNFAALADVADALARRAHDVLGREAAVAYALIALALERLGQTRRAQEYYECATRLVTPEELAREYADLAALAQALAPARSPL